MFARLSFVLLAYVSVAFCTEGTQAASPTGGGSGTVPQQQSTLLNAANMTVDRHGIVRTIANLDVSAGATSVEQNSRQFLEQNKSLLRLDNVKDQLRTGRVDRVPGGTHIRYTQSHQGVPVYGAEIVVSSDDQNRIRMVVNGSRNAINIGVLPSFSGTEAIVIARTHLQATGPAIGAPESAELVVYPIDDSNYKLAYRVTMTYERPAGDWELFIDARSGEVLTKRDRFVQYQDPVYVQGKGAVYLSDPLSTSRHRYGDPGFSDNDDADSDSLRAYRSVVRLDSILFEDGVFKLKGPSCTITEIESPADPAEYTSPTADGFLYTRDQDSFEAVNAYYHVTNAYKRLVSLGFTSEKLRKLRVDPHGFQGQDNSHYSPTGHWIGFGIGGVDDAEDADVIWHEYAHAIQYTFVPAWSGTESAALAEGFADYWAASYSRSLHQWSSGDEQYNWVYKWDGHNSFWKGRVLNDARTYPFGSQSVHSAGQIWSAALMGIWGDLGRDITDRLVIKSLFYLGSNITAGDFSRAIIQADRDLYNGAHLTTLLYWLGTVKRFIDVATIPPAIAHVPLPNTESLIGPYKVKARILPAWSTLPATVRLVWGQDGVFTDSSEMVSTGDPGEYVGQISSIQKIAHYCYYIVSVDSNGSRLSSPTNAPQEYYSFQAGVLTTSMEQQPAQTPETSALAQNYPNPFNPKTVVSYQLSEVSEVKLAIYDMLGREVALLAHGTTQAGSHAVSFNASGLASGVYVYRLEAKPIGSGERQTFVQTKKMVLAK